MGKWRNGEGITEKGDKWESEICATWCVKPALLYYTEELSCEAGEMPALPAKALCTCPVFYRQGLFLNCVTFATFPATPSSTTMVVAVFLVICPSMVFPLP